MVCLALFGGFPTLLGVFGYCLDNSDIVMMVYWWFLKETIASLSGSNLVISYADLGVFRRF